MSLTGQISGVIEFSAVDGPGNRFVLFTQGCNFNCLACHNPYTINLCNDCGVCVDACGSSALDVVGGRVVWNPDRCTGEDACIRICPYDSTPKAGPLRVADVLERLRPNVPFISGVTVSGGEATQQSGFVAALFAAIKADPTLSRLTCFVDSNGAAPRSVWDELDPVLDAAMIDLKCFDDAIHRELVGSGNAQVLESIRLLAGRGKLYEVRLLLAAGVNDSDELLARTGAWLAQINPTMRLKIIGFRAHGVRPSPVPLVEPTAEQRAHYAEVLRNQGDFQLLVI